jgi:hypothetical protein
MIERWRWRLGAGLILAGGLFLLGPWTAATRADGPATGPALDNAPWAITLESAALYGGPGEETASFGRLPVLSPVKVLKYDGEWAYVYEPRARGTGFLRSELLGPSDPPSRYLMMAAPPVEAPLVERGILTATAPLAIYPTAAEEAFERRLSPNTWVSLDAVVRGEDGDVWYRTVDGNYVPGDVVFLPGRPDEFNGRWLDVNLSVPARVTAYEGDTPVRSFLTIKGAGPRPTPTGVFTILRRVANETMNSDTIGIPRFGPGGYYLTNVLFTQYFTGDGASLHYNYWSSSFGYAGSHGCLGLTYGDSDWLWEWAHVGTPLMIHY